MKALAAIMGGPVNSSGAALYSDWAWDPGMGAIGMSSWRGWKLGLPVMGGFSPDPSGVTHEFLAKYNFDQDAPKISGTSGEYNESALDFMQPPNVTKLDAFAAKHGKLLVYHGTAAPVCAPTPRQRPAPAPTF
jgi:feruloyl esterase